MGMYKGVVSIVHLLQEFFNEDNAACTNGIESDWRHAKVSMPCYGVHRGMHGAYLAEFMWR